MPDPAHPNLPEVEAASFTAHKFMTLNDHCWESLETSKFYFSPPRKLDDPADCQIDILKAFRLARASQGLGVRADEEARVRDLANDIETHAKTCGVFSLCAGAIDGEKERLLWAHYAKNHSGICLTFTFPFAFLTDQLIGYAPVTYTPELLFEALKRLNLSRVPDPATELPIIKSFLTTKASEWAYQSEARIISSDPGLLEFDRHWLRQICFGLNTTDRDRERVRHLASYYPNCRVAEVVRSDHDLFGLVLRESSQ